MLQLSLSKKRRPQVRGGGRGEWGTEKASLSTVGTTLLSCAPRDVSLRVLQDLSSGSTFLHLGGMMTEWLSYYTCWECYGVNRGEWVNKWNSYHHETSSVVYLLTYRENDVQMFVNAHEE